MKSKLFKLLPLVLFSLAATGYSENGSSEQSNACFEQGHPLKENQIPSAYNAPARINVEGSWDFYVTGSFIYWQPKLDGLNSGSYGMDTVTHKKGGFAQMDFDYKPGFKVGLGMNSTFDNWTFYAEYTWIHADEHKGFTVPNLSPTTALPVWNEDASGFDSVSSKWDHHNNIVDFNIGRPYYVGTNLSFAPFAGFRAYWMENAMDVLYTVTTPNDYEGHATNGSWAVGARVGIESNWMLTQDFRVIGKAAGSLAYQKIHTFFKELDSAVIQDKIRTEYSQITPNVEAALGLGWGTYFSSKEWHFDISALYEFHYFWNQNSMRGLVDEAIFVNPARNLDLMYQGLTVTMKLDF
jgi:hypothetical protein